MYMPEIWKMLITKHFSMAWFHGRSCWFNQETPFHVVKLFTRGARQSLRLHKPDKQTFAPILIGPTFLGQEINNKQEDQFPLSAHPALLLTAWARKNKLQAWTWCRNGKRFSLSSSAARILPSVATGRKFDDLVRPPCARKHECGLRSNALFWQVACKILTIG